MEDIKKETLIAKSFEKLKIGNKVELYVGLKFNVIDKIDWNTFDDPRYSKFQDEIENIKSTMEEDDYFMTEEGYPGGVVIFDDELRTNEFYFYDESGAICYKKQKTSKQKNKI